MEKHAEVKKVALIAKEATFLVEALSASLLNSPQCSVEVFIEKNIVDQQDSFRKNLDLFDIALLDEVLVSFDEIVYVEHLWHFITKHDDFQRRLNDLNNVVNICTDHHIRLIYVGGFTSNYGQHLDIKVDEKTIWESSVDVSLHDKYIHLSIQELYRAKEEGLGTTIVSCGLPYTSKQADMIHQFMKAHRPLADHYHFIDQKDIIDTVLYLSAMDNKANRPDKLLLINLSIEKEKLIHKLGIQKPWYLKIWPFSSTHTSVQRDINISIEKTLTFLNKTFIPIHIFDQQ